MSAGIYCIENLINGKKYVGQSINLERRMKSKHYHCFALLNAIKKYGRKKFKKYIIEICTENELFEKEKFYIKLLHSHCSEWGYNISYGDVSPMTGRKHSDKSKEKMRDSAIGRVVSDETRKILSEMRAGEKNCNFGKHPSEETLKRMSDAKSGKNHPMWGKSCSEKTKEKLRDANLGKENPNFGKKLKSASSKYFGVGKESKTTKNKKYDYWRVRIRRFGKLVSVGAYGIELEAARAYDKYIFENNLPNPLNFPEEYNQNNTLDKTE